MSTALGKRQRLSADEKAAMSPGDFEDFLWARVPKQFTLKLRLLLRPDTNRTGGLEYAWAHTVDIPLRECLDLSWGVVLKAALANRQPKIEVELKRNGIRLLDYHYYLQCNQAIKFVQLDPLNEDMIPFIHAHDTRRWEEFAQMQHVYNIKNLGSKKLRTVRDVLALHPDLFATPDKYLLLVEKQITKEAKLHAKPVAKKPPVRKQAAGAGGAASSGAGGGGAGDQALAAHRLPEKEQRAMGSSRLEHAVGSAFGTRLNDDQRAGFVEMQGALQAAPGLQVHNLQQKTQLTFDELQLMEDHVYLKHDTYHRLLTCPTFSNLQAKQEAVVALFRRNIDLNKWTFVGTAFLISNRYLQLCLHEIYHDSRTAAHEPPANAAPGTLGAARECAYLQPLCERSNPNSDFMVWLINKRTSGTRNQRDCIRFNLNNIVYPHDHATLKNLGFDVCIVDLWPEGFEAYVARRNEPKKRGGARRAAAASAAAAAVKAESAAETSDDDDDDEPALAPIPPEFVEANILVNTYGRQNTIHLFEDETDSVQLVDCTNIKQDVCQKLTLLGCRLGIGTSGVVFVCQPGSPLLANSNYESFYTIPTVGGMSGAAVLLSDGRLLLMHRRSGPATAQRQSPDHNASMYNAGLRMDLFLRDAFGMYSRALNHTSSNHSPGALTQGIRTMLENLRKFYDVDRRLQLPREARQRPPARRRV